MGILSLVLFAGAGSVAKNNPQFLMRRAEFPFDWGRGFCNSRPKKLGIRLGIRMGIVKFGGVCGVSPDAVAPPNNAP